MIAELFLFIKYYFVLEKLVIITAPSGSGKTTIVKQIMQRFPQLKFSISAATRSPRLGEVDGKDYYFLAVEDFKQKIANNDFLEWEMVYEGKYYGTPKSELHRIWKEQNVPIVDIDVVGASNVKAMYPNNSLSIFIQAPTLEILKERLTNRGTETADTLSERLARAEFEMTYADKFDVRIINDNLEEAVGKVVEELNRFL